MGGQLWVSAAGLETRAADVNTLAQDIANVDTAGFRALLPVDTDAAPQPVYPSGLTVGPAAPAEILANGGVAPATDDIDWSQGSLQQTGQPLDVAIIGQGLFMLQDAAAPGGVAYTRAGDFQVDASGQIADASGRLLLDENGQPITLPAGASNPQIAADGTVTADTGASDPTVVARIGLAFPTAPQGMQASGFGVWTSTPAAGTVATAAPNGSTTRLQSGALEQSNSNLVTLLPQLLAAQEAYTANSRAVSVGLQLWQMSNGLRG